VLLLLFAFSPALITGYWISESAVNVPVWDGWERGPLIQKSHDGTLDMEYLSSAHIDHRPLVPRLLILASNRLSGGDVRVEMWIGFFAILGGAIGLFYVLRKTFGDCSWMWVTAFLINLILFSPVQYQNFLWAVQMAFLLPLGCLGMIIGVMRSKWKLWVKFPICLLLAEVGTFSFGHGLVLWPVVVCLALMIRGFAPTLQRLIFAGAMTAIAAVTVYIYFNVNYINTSQPKHAYGTMPGEPPPAIDRVENVKENFRDVKYYFWSSIGNVMARCFHSDPREASVNTGRALMWVFGACVVWMLVRWKRDPDWKALLPWAAVGTFSIVVAVMLATGRGATMPFARSLMPRYMSQTLYVCVAVVVMVAYILWRYRESATGAKAQRLTYLGICLAMGFATLQWHQWVYGIHKMEAWKIARLEARFELLYLKHFEPRHPDRIDGDIDEAKEGEIPFSIRQAMYLNSKGLLNPPMFENKDFGTFEKLDERAQLKRADLLRAVVVSNEKIYVRGYGTQRDKRIADGILITWRIAEGDPIPNNLKNDAKERATIKRILSSDWQLLDVAEIYAAPTLKAPFLDGQFGENGGNFAREKNFARFDKDIDISSLPEDELIDILFWVADTEHMIVLPMKRVLRIKRKRLEPGQELFEGK